MAEDNFVVEVAPGAARRGRPAGPIRRRITSVGRSARPPRLPLVPPPLLPLFRRSYVCVSREIETTVTASRALQLN